MDREIETAKTEMAQMVDVVALDGSKGPGRWHGDKLMWFWALVHPGLLLFCVHM